MNYGKEPFDLRLTVLRMVRNLPVIIGVTVLGVLLFGGGYYVKNVLLNGDTTYTVTSTYRVSYVNEPSQSGDYYINEMTWNTYVDSKEFLDGVWAHLEEALGYDSLYAESSEELAGMIEAKLASDLHVPSTVVTTESVEWTQLLAKAVEETMVAEFVENNEQVAGIEVIDPAVVATEVVPDVRPVRAFVLSGMLSFFFVMVFLLLKELGEDCIWLPATLRRRYGLTVVGTLNSPDMKANLEFLFDNQEKVAVCAVEEETSPGEVIAALRTRFTDDANQKQAGSKIQFQNWIPVPAPMLCPEEGEVMRDTDGVLLVVRAGRGAGKNLEYILEYLTTQEIKVTAALLWDADEWLLRMYYGKVWL